MTGPQIELAGIERVFHLGDSVVHALASIDLSIEAGEYLSVMGPSGSGKSTLLNVLGLLDSPNAGTYHLEGRDITTLSPRWKTRSMPASSICGPSILPPSPCGLSPLGGASAFGAAVRRSLTMALTCPG